MANKIAPSLPLVSLILIGLLQLVALAQTEVALQPDIVLIYADDLGYSDLGCYGNEYHETPQIDALVSKGVRFTEAYSGAPLCAPSRIALFTGRYCARAGSYETTKGKWNETKYMLRESGGNTEGLDMECEKKVGFDMPRNNIELPRDRKTLSEYLKEAGYFTGFVGKWHMGSQKPTGRGFDEYAQIETYPPGANLDTSKGRSSRSPTYPEPQGHIGDYMARSAIHFIDRSGDRPFFLYMAHPLPHTPHEAEPSLIRKYRDKPAGVTHSNPIYAAMIEMLDESVGKVIATLRDRGTLDDTLVIFTSDNGAMQGPVLESPELGGYELGNVTTNYPLRGGKVQLWEGGIRIPMAIVFGNRFATTDFDKVVSQMDILPTLLDLTGHPDAATADELLDGKSLMPILSDPSRHWEDRSLFWHYPGYRGLSLKPTPDGRRPGFVQRPATVVRYGDWKLHQSLETGDVRLYDLVEDIGERTNVADRHPDVVRRLEAQIAAWQKETDAPMPIRKQGVERPTAGIDTAYYCGPLGPVKSPDPAVNAFMMYNALDAMRVKADINDKESSVGVLATKGPKSMSILLWNYPFDAERVSQPRTPPGTPPRDRQGFFQKRMQALTDMVADEMQKPARQVEVILENLPTENCTYKQYVVDAAHCSQLMEKVDEGRLPAGDGPQIRIALEPYGLTMTKLNTD